ncbi:MAG: phosphoglycerate dehydrogenase-like enzyme [Candidatus Azotimanducaceae bacterium]
MTHLRHALVALPWPEATCAGVIKHLDAERVTVCAPTDQAAISEALATADVAVTSARVDRRFLDAPSLRWLHLDRAGIDQFAPPALFENRIVTTSSGRSSPAVADQAILLLSAVSGNMRTIEVLRRRRIWSRNPLANLRALHGRHVVVIGCGSVGTEIARRLATMGLTVTGIARRERNDPTPFERVLASPTRATLLAELANADVLILAAGLNDATHHLVDRSALDALGPDGIVVNVARGGMIDQRSLVQALRDKRLAGAGLAVGEPEPLPPWSRLWTAPNTIVIPHTVPRLDARHERSAEIICEIADTVRSGGTVERALTVDDAYTKRPPRSDLDLFCTRAWNWLALRTVRGRSDA